MKRKNNNTKAPGYGDMNDTPSAVSKSACWGSFETPGSAARFFSDLDAIRKTLAAFGA